MSEIDQLVYKHRRTMRKLLEIHYENVAFWEQQLSEVDHDPIARPIVSGKLQKARDEMGTLEGEYEDVMIQSSNIEDAYLIHLRELEIQTESRLEKVMHNLRI